MYCIIMQFRLDLRVNSHFYLQVLSLKCAQQNVFLTFIL